jgi:hypothetical protein
MLCCQQRRSTVANGAGMPAVDGRIMPVRTFCRMYCGVAPMYGILRVNISYLCFGLAFHLSEAHVLQLHARVRVWLLAWLVGWDRWNECMRAGMGGVRGLGGDTHANANDLVAKTHPGARFSTTNGNQPT